MINSSVYVFGNLRNGYTQYPKDYTDEIYKNFYSSSTAQTQIIIHRNENLIYYGYIYKLDTASQYIGFCILLNGVMFTKIKELFPIFENAVDQLISRGEIFGLNKEGNLISTINSLSEHQQAVERITSFIHSSIIQLENDVDKIPPVSYGIANTDSKCYSINDSDKDIADSSVKFGYTFLYKNNNYETPSFTSQKKTIKELHEENVLLTTNYNLLQQKYNTLNVQKKQYRKVFILGAIILVGIIVLLSLKTALEYTKSNLNNAQNNITQKENKIGNLNQRMSNLQNSLRSEDIKRQQAEQELQSLKNSISTYYPIIITNVEIANVEADGTPISDFGSVIYSNSSKYLKFQITYQGINVDENITLKINLFTPADYNIKPSPDISWDESFLVLEGDNTQSFRDVGSSMSGYWEKGTYRYEFWYGDVCLKANTFVIY